MLTKREQEVLDLLRLHVRLSVSELSVHLGISVRTAENHLQALRKKHAAFPSAVGCKAQWSAEDQWHEEGQQIGRVASVWAYAQGKQF